MNRKRIGILLFNDIEVLDYCGPFEVFSVTRLDEVRRRMDPSPFEVILVAETMDVITTSGGMKVLPTVSFADCQPLDILVVPGGMGTRKEMLNEIVLRFVKEQAARCELVASVCTGSLILGKAGLLDGLKATTHWRSLDLMRDLFPKVEVDGSSHIVDEGRIITSAGISAGIDLALKIVQRYFGESIARNTARHMEYPFPESNTRRITLEDQVTPPDYQVKFDALDWVVPMEGVRCKIHREGQRQLRIVEYSKAMPVHWCEKGHLGLILHGQFEIEFEHRTKVFEEGDGVFIPEGSAHKHRARVLSETVRVVFVENV
jgi:putative intracellular protease/amidase